MKIRIHLIFSFFYAFASVHAGLPSPIDTHIDDASRVGETRVNVFIWDIYDIALYAPAQQFDEDKPFALRLNYLRNLKGNLIAERSIEEMRRQGINEVKLAAWFSQLEDIFPDVEKGTELIGVFLPGRATRFYKNGEFIGQVLDPDFVIPFSDIWLGENSSIPSIRNEILGGKS